MHVTYSPESGDVQSWEFNPDTVRSSKAEMIEKRFGQSWDQWKAAVQQGSIKARRVLLWHLMTQQHPTMRMEDMPDFAAGELVVEYTAGELRALRANVEKSKALSAEDKVDVLAALDGEIEAAALRDGENAEDADPDETPGKAPSKRGAKSTSSP